MSISRPRCILRCGVRNARFFVLVIPPTGKNGLCYNKNATLVYINDRIMAMFTSYKILSALHSVSRPTLLFEILMSMKCKQKDT